MTPGTAGEGTPDPTRGTLRRRTGAVAVLGVLPWTVLVVGGEATTLVFLPGLVDVAGLLRGSVHVVPLWRVLEAGGGLPRNPATWPTSLGLYCLALASACGGLVRGGGESGRGSGENARLTAVLLVLAALVHLGVAFAFLHRRAYLPLPVGPVAATIIVWWYYGPALRAALLGPGG